MMSHPVAMPALALALFAGLSCTRGHVAENLPLAQGPAMLAAALPQPPPASDDDDPAGTLVFRDDVMQKCVAMKRFEGHTHDDDVALDALRAMGECMTKGNLRGARVFVFGGGKATRLFREALGKFGVAEKQLETTVSDSEEVDQRVEVGLTKHAIPGRKADVSLPVHRSQVVGFLVAGSLDD